MREFEVAVGRSAFNSDGEVTFKLDEDELTAKPPTAGQLALFLRGGREGGMASLQSLLDLMESVLSREHYRLVQRRLKQGMEIGVVSQIAAYLVEEWSGRPILLPSGSTPMPNGTGEPSTEPPQLVESTF